MQLISKGVSTFTRDVVMCLAVNYHTDVGKLGLNFATLKCRACSDLVSLISILKCVNSWEGVL